MPKKAPTAWWASAENFAKLIGLLITLAAIFLKAGALQYQIEHGNDLLAWQMAELAKQEATHYADAQAWRAELQRKIERIEAERTRR